MTDVRMALRVFRKSPAYALIAVCTLGVAIGGATLIFSVLNAVVLRPLPFPASDRLVMLRDSNPPRFPEFSVSPGRFLAWQARTRAFEDVAASTSASVNLTGTGDPVRLIGAEVSANLFATLRVAPILGRTFTTAEDRPGNDLEIMLSEGVWRDEFGAAADIVGRKLVIDDKARLVIGVLPQTFHYPTALTQVWLPLALTDEQRHIYGSHWLAVIARLRPGVSLGAAQADQTRIARDLEPIDEGNKGWTSIVIPYLDFQIRGVRAGVWLLSAAVFVVLLIACANIANLLLARGIARKREFGIRAALGASRVRLVRQLLVENLVLAVAGSALGVAISALGLRLLLASSSTGLPRADSIALDRPTLAFAALLAGTTPLLFGLLPAVQLSRGDLRELLAQGGRSAAAGLRTRTRAVLIVGEIGLAITLVASSVLLLRSFVRVMEVSPGFETSRQFLVGVSLPEVRYRTDAQREAFWRNLINAVERVPGVDAAGVSQSVPFLGDFVDDFQIPGKITSDATQWPSANFYAVTPDYLKTMGIPVLRGRGFTRNDRTESARVVLISQSLAARYFGTENPVGRQLVVTQGPTLAPAAIVGVVGDVKQYGLEAPTSMQVYAPASQHPYFSTMYFLVRLSGTAGTVTSSVRGVLRQLDPHLPILSARTLGSFVDASVGPRRLTAVCLALFAVVALALAVVGTYGLVSFTVSQRASEIGLRVALGASRARVLGLVFRQGLALAAVGCAAGLVGAVWATRLLSSQLFESTGGDAVTAFVGAPGALLLAVVVACYVPARRALGVDPVAALRQS